MVFVLAQQPRANFDRHGEAYEGGRAVGQITAYVIIAVIVGWVIVRVLRKKDDSTASAHKQTEERQSVSLQCWRCRREFMANELRPPSLLLRFFAAPYFLLLLRQSSTLRGEATALYCRSCRRQLNVCFFFVAFLVVLFGTTQLIQYLGLNRHSAPTPPPRTNFPSPVAAGQGVTAQRPRSSWTSYKSEDGGFTVQMPGTPKISSQPGGLFTVNIASCTDGKAYFMVTFFDPPPRSVAPGVVDSTMKRDRDISIQGIQGTLKSEEKVTIRKDDRDWPGLASVIENASSLYTSRLYAVQGRMYSLQVAQPKDEDRSADIAKFFDSFTVATD